jgi:hypothetical protein
MLDPDPGPMNPDPQHWVTVTYDTGTLLGYYINLYMQLLFRYGGKFGVETDRMDKSAVGHDYIEKVMKNLKYNF